MQLLDRIRPPKFSGEAVPALIMALGSDQREVRAWPPPVSASFKQSAREAIPALIPMLREPIESDPVGPGIASLERISREPALAAAEALGQIAPGTNAAGLAVAALAEAVRSENLEERTRAAGALEQFGPEAAAAVPALIAALRQTIATEKPLVAFTRENIPDDSQLAGVMIVIALARIAPGTALTDEVVTVLTKALSSRSIYTRHGGHRGSRRAGAQGCRNDSPSPRLQNDPDPDVREASKAALKRREE